MHLNQNYIKINIIFFVAVREKLHLFKKDDLNLIKINLFKKDEFELH